MAVSLDPNTLAANTPTSDTAVDDSEPTGLHSGTATPEPWFRDGFESAGREDVLAEFGSRGPGDAAITRLAGGFAASQARLQTLESRLADLDLQAQSLRQSRSQVANTVASLTRMLEGLEPGSTEARQVAARLDAIQALDKSLEIQLRRIETQREAVQTEIEAVRKVIDKNIQSSFKTFG